MDHLDKAIEKLKALTLQMIQSKSDSELLAIILEPCEWEEDYIKLVKTEITKRLIN